MCWESKAQFLELHNLLLTAALRYLGFTKQDKKDHHHDKKYRQINYLYFLHYLKLTARASKPISINFI